MTQTVILWPLRRPPLQASSKTGPFFFFFFWRGGWDGWIGGRGKAREFRRVGSLALVGGDLGACCCFIPPTCFSSLLVPGNNPLRKKRPHRGSRCEIRSFSMSRLFFRLVCLVMCCVVCSSWSDLFSPPEGLSNVGGT